MCSDKSEGIPRACHGGRAVFEVCIRNGEHLYGGRIAYRSVGWDGVPECF